MAAGTIMERPTGAIDGSNRIFTTSRWYVAGTVRAFTPTLQAPASVTELGQDRVQLEEAPYTGDLVYILYRAV